MQYTQLGCYMAFPCLSLPSLCAICINLPEFVYEWSTLSKDDVNRESAVLYSTHKVRTYKEYHSVCPSSELGLPPTPLPQANVPPPPPVSGGRGTLAGEKGVGRVPIPTRGIHCGTLYMYVLCDSTTFHSKTIIMFSFQKFCLSIVQCTFNFCFLKYWHVFFMKVISWAVTYISI